MPNPAARKCSGLLWADFISYDRTGEAIVSVGAETQKGVDIELYRKMLTVALEEAQQGRAEGGIPIGAALFTRSGELLSR